jgi:hypothetical protein
MLWRPAETYPSWGGAETGVEPVGQAVRSSRDAEAAGNATRSVRPTVDPAALAEPGAGHHTTEVASFG